MPEVNGTADLTTTVEADAREIKPGMTVTYAVTVKNNGPDAAAAPVLSYDAPTGLTDVYFSTDGGYSWELWKGTHTLAELASGASTNVLIRGAAPANVSGTVSGTFNVTSPSHDPNPADNTATSALAAAPAAPVPVSSLSATATSDNDSPKPGDVVTYTVTVKNYGPAGAPSPTVDFAATPLLGNIEYSTDKGSTWQPWAGGVTLRDMPSGTTSSLLVRGEIPVNVSGGLSASFTAKSSNSDPDPDDNTAIVSTTVTPTADLVTTVTAGNPAPKPGDSVNYTVTVHNNGPSTATAPTVMFSPPKSLTNVSYSTDGGATWQTWPGSAALSDLPNGGDAKLLLRAISVQNTEQTVEMVLATASGASDLNSANSTAGSSAPATPAPASTADLVTTMTADNPSPKPGDKITFTITVTNNGPAAAKAPTVKDTLPPQLTGGEYSTDGGKTWKPWPGSATLPDLANGASTQVLIRATVAAGATAAIANSVSVSSPNAAGGAASAQSASNCKCCIIKYYLDDCRQYGWEKAACGASVKAPPPPCKNGSEFKGWFTDAALTAEWDFSKPVTADMPLYAKWTVSS